MAKHDVKLIRQKHPATCWVACALMMHRWKVGTYLGETVASISEAWLSNKDEKMGKKIDELKRGMKSAEIRTIVREWGFDYFDRTIDRSDLKTYLPKRPLCWGGEKNGYHGHFGGPIPIHAVIIRGYQEIDGRLKLWLRDPATPEGLANDTGWTEWFHDDLVRVFPNNGFFFMR